MCIPALVSLLIVAMPAIRANASVRAVIIQNHNGTVEASTGATDCFKTVVIDPSGTTDDSCSQVCGSLSTLHSTFSTTADPARPIKEIDGSGRLVAAGFILCHAQTTFELDYGLEVDQTTHVTIDLTDTPSGNLNRFSGDQTLSRISLNDNTVYCRNNSDCAAADINNTPFSGRFEFDLSPGTPVLKLAFSCKAGGRSSPVRNVNLDFTIKIGFSINPPPGNEFHWVSPTGGDFGLASNWNPARVPGGSDTAIFDLGGNGAPVDVSASSATVARWLVDQMSVHLHGSAQAAGTVSPGDSHFEVRTAGSFVLDNGSTFSSDDGLVGAPAGTNEASVFVSGAGTHWTDGAVVPGLQIGPSGPGKVVVDHDGVLTEQTSIQLGGVAAGTLRVESGGQVQTPQCLVKNGSVQVRGAGAARSALTTSADLEIAAGNGTASLVIESGGRVNAQGQVLVGAPNGVGTITVSGTDPSGLGSSLAIDSNTRTVIGGVPGTQVEVSDGGTFSTSDTVLIGTGVTPGTVSVHHTVSPAGLTLHPVWTAGPGAIFVGSKNQASELTVEDGGGINTSGPIHIGEGGDELGHFTVSGDASVVCDDLVVGSDGHGTLVIDGGALVESTGNGAVGDALLNNGQTPGSGVVTINSGITADTRWHVHGDLNVGTTGASGDIFLASQGFVSIPTGLGLAILTVDGTLTVGPKGAIHGNGKLAVLPGKRVVNGGLIDPGLSPGRIEIDGDYEQTSAGVLKIEVAGLDAGKFDVLKISGNATLAGRVDLQFINGFVPKAGDNVDFAQVSGQITGKLTGDTLIVVPGNSSTGSGDTATSQPATDQPVAQATVKWEVTPEGTCRMTVTSVSASDQAGGTAPAVPGCGAGSCGAGVVPMMPLTLVGMSVMKLGRRRPRQDSR
jgi:T5SS/PEP-CTERM-associated repeat protein